ncbi:MAG: aspartate 1-decarboxylase [Candidatus Omnitrophota bacterium]|nr:MAG: aspartate 1-decarboxylase [Candidatus Omnitrophota bacterium]
MLIWFCRSKIKGGKVTEKKLHYEGSITLDKEIIEKADIIPGEMVYVLNLNNGARITTYVIEGERNSGTICINGPASRFFEVNDEVIILATSLMDKKEAEKTKMKLVVLDNGNKIKEIKEI